MGQSERTPVETLSHCILIYIFISSLLPQRQRPLPPSQQRERRRASRTAAAAAAPLPSHRSRHRNHRSRRRTQRQAGACNIRHCKKARRREGETRRREGGKKRERVNTQTHTSLHRQFTLGSLAGIPLRQRAQPTCVCVCVCVVCVGGVTWAWCSLRELTKRTSGSLGRSARGAARKGRRSRRCHLHTLHWETPASAG